MADFGQDIFASLQEIPEITATNGAELEPHYAKGRPFVVRGLVRDWPLVKAGNISGQDAREYLLTKCHDRTFPVTLGDVDCGGRVFYKDDMSMNIRMADRKLPDVFVEMMEHETDEKQPLIYLGSIDMGKYFNGLNAENRVDVGERNCLESIWIGLRTITSAHTDFPDNLACVAVGKRRFTLFPPDQFRNLYVGPLENTPAGRPVSMVDLRNPDFDKYPKFATALEHGMTAVLKSGDTVFIPSMWWHDVESLSPFNALVNYWWRPSPAYLGHPQDALFHAILAVRDLPQAQKQHWRDLFDHYVFYNTDDITAHIPQGDQTILGPLGPENASRIRTYLLRALNQ